MKPIILPEEKLDELANKVCARILNGHYFTNGVIRGEELKDFADHQQVNKFLLFQIYQTWTLQLSKLKHAYFDFSHPEVEQGLKNLRNLLSRHIQITENDFQPLLKRAVYNNIKLLLNPENSFESFFFVDSDQISLETFSQYGPFFSDMDFIVNSILRYHQKHELESVEKGMFFLKMEKVIELYNQKSGTNFGEYQKQTLNKLLHENIDDILQQVQEEQSQTLSEGPVVEASSDQVEAPAIEEAEVPQNVAEKKVVEEANFFETVIAENENTHFDLDLSDDLVPSVSHTENPGTVETPIASPAEPVLPREEPAVSPTFMSPPSEERSPAEPISMESEPQQPSTVEEALSAILNKESPQKSVFDSISDDTSSPAESTEPSYTPPVFESFPNSPKPPIFSQVREENNGEYITSTPQTPVSPASDSPQTIAEKYQTQVTEEPAVSPAIGGGQEIKLSDIPIHRQYQYVQKVFEGNNVRFRIIVDKVNNSKNRDEVESIIDRFILSNSGLNKGDEVVQEFIKMLRSRH